MRVKETIRNAMGRSFPKMLQRYIILRNKISTSPDSYVKVKSVAIESTNICNSKCIFCPQGTGELKRKKEIMKNDLFFHLMDICKREGIENIHFGGIGEFLYDKEFMTKANYIVKSGLIFDSLTTNAMLLEPEVTKELCKLNLKNLNVSIDTLDKKQYESIRRNLNFDKVIKNVIFFLDYNINENNANTSVVINATIFEDNDEQKPNFIETFKKYFNHNFRIVFYPKHNWSGSSSLETNNNNMYICKTKCNRVFSSLVQIRVDGSVSLCCLDYNNEYLKEKINDSINEMWNSEAMKIIRRIHVDGKWDKIAICNNCSEININRPCLESIRSPLDWPVDS